MYLKEMKSSRKSDPRPAISQQYVYNTKTGKQKSLLMNECGLKNHGAYIQQDFYPAFKKQMLTFARLWINVKDIILNKISQIQKDK